MALFSLHSLAVKSRFLHTPLIIIPRYKWNSSSLRPRIDLKSNRAESQQLESKASSQDYAYLMKTCEFVYDREMCERNASERRAQFISESESHRREPFQLRERPSMGRAGEISLSHSACSALWTHVCIVPCYEPLGWLPGIYIFTQRELHYVFNIFIVLIYIYVVIRNFFSRMIGRTWVFIQHELHSVRLDYQFQRISLYTRTDQLTSNS